MIDYNPAYWKSTRMRKCFVYLMRYDEIRTIQHLSKIKARVVDRRIYINMEKRGDKYYWGWIGFDKPIPLWDAMEAGLVPIFRARQENKK